MKITELSMKSRNCLIEENLFDEYKLENLRLVLEYFAQEKLPPFNL